MGFLTMFGPATDLKSVAGFFSFDISAPFMSLSGASLNRFRNRVDAVLDDAFPVTLIIASVPVAAAGPGGKTVTDFMDAGESTNFRFPFRILKSLLATPPAVGDAIDWQIEVGNTLPLEVAEIAVRPHEDRYSIICKSRRRA
jgi:hypothetical protein